MADIPLALALSSVLTAAVGAHDRLRLLAALQTPAAPPPGRLLLLGARHVDDAAPEVDRSGRTGAASSVA